MKILIKKNRTEDCGIWLTILILHQRPHWTFNSLSVIWLKMVPIFLTQTWGNYWCPRHGLLMWLLRTNTGSLVSYKQPSTGIKANSFMPWCGLTICKHAWSWSRCDIFHKKHVGLCEPLLHHTQRYHACFYPYSSDESVGIYLYFYLVLLLKSSLKLS